LIDDQGSSRERGCVGTIIAYSTYKQISERVITPINISPKCNLDGEGAGYSPRVNVFENRCNSLCKAHLFGTYLDSLDWNACYE
jgi:hypothetical protein